MARVAVGQAAVLTFVLALNNFAVPVILQVRVFPEELWLAFTTRLDEAGAWTAAWPLMVMPALGLLLLRRANVSWPNRDGAVSGEIFRRQLGRGWFVGCAVITALLLVLGVWLALIFATFGLFAPSNAVVVAALMGCALSASGAVFLILEMNSPFTGLITLSSAPMHEALHYLGN